jgi:hypothetical protein
MTGMTYRMRMLTYITAAAVVVATITGCGLLSSAKHLASNVGTLGDLSNKLTAAEKLTYRADYKASDGSTNTLAQAPPKTAFLGKDADWIFDGSNIYTCDTENSALACTKTVETNTADPEAVLAAGGFGNAGFFSGALGIALLAAAMLVPSAKIVKTSKKIAGLNSTCVDVSNIDGAKDGTEDLKDFSMCVADNGVVTQFEGTDTDGKKSGITMTAFSTKVDDSLFQPPAGATITDAGALPGLPSSAPTAAPSGAASPLPSPSTT